MRAALQGVVREAVIAASLTALMILLFLGSWRSTLIVAISIPLSILTSIIVLKFLGETLNVMTLGGLALAVGILVDDATVEIENIHRNLGQGKALEPAILDGAAQIAVPAFVSTLAICIVFVPVVFLSGAAKSLFTPLAMAVVFAMLASYLLSRTLVPTMVKFLLASEVEMYQDHEAGRITEVAKECELDLADALPLQRGVRAVSRALSRRAGLGAGPCGFTVGLLCTLRRDLRVPAAVHRAGLLSRRRCRNLPAACAHRRPARALKRPNRIFSRSGGDDSRSRFLPKELGLVLDDIGLPKAASTWPSATAA